METEFIVTRSDDPEQIGRTDTLGIPSAGMRLTMRAREILERRLVAYGNTLSATHSHALHLMLDGFTRLAEGALGRRAFGMPTGSGKSQAIVAHAAACVELGRIGGPHADLSIAIACEQVEALCELCREMVAAGVPRELIGLRHTFALDPAASLWSDGAPPAGYIPPDGKASIAPDDDACERPILLVTHMRVHRPKKGEEHRRFPEWYAYKGNRRSLLINDEALFRSEDTSVIWSDLAGAFDLLRRHLKHAPTLEFLSTLDDKVTAEIEAQAEGAAPVPFRLSITDDAQRAEYAEAIREASQRMVTSRRSPVDPKIAASLLSDFLAKFDTEIVIAGGKDAGHHEALLTFRPTIDDAIQGVAILDASFKLRRLYEYDPTVRDALKGFEGKIKGYDNVTIKHTNMASGRWEVNEDLSSKGEGKYIDYCAEAIQSAPADEHVLIFTFKGREGKSSVDCERALREGLLERYGIDCDAPVPLKAEIDPQHAGQMRKRVSFLTWGKETSRSDLKFCTTIILAGLHYLPREAVHAKIKGQARDLARHADRKEITEVHLSETISSIYQASARGSSRTMSNGQAFRMTMHLPIATQPRKVMRRLRAIMPGLRWETAPDPVIAVADVMEEFLRSLPPDVSTVSLAKLNKHAEQALAAEWGDKITRKRVEAGRDLCEEQCEGWERSGRSMVRV